MSTTLSIAALYKLIKMHIIRKIKISFYSKPLRNLIKILAKASHSSQVLMWLLLDDA